MVSAGVAIDIDNSYAMILRMIDNFKEIYEDLVFLIKKRT